MYAELADLFSRADEEYEPIVPRIGRRKSRPTLEGARGRRRNSLTKATRTIGKPIRPSPTDERKSMQKRQGAARAKISAGRAQRKQSPRDISTGGYRDATESRPSDNPVKSMMAQVAKLTTPTQQVRSFRPNPVGFALPSDGERRATTQETASKQVDSQLLNYTNTMSAVYAAEQQRRQTQTMMEEVRDKKLSEHLQVAEARTTNMVEEEADLLQRIAPQEQQARAPAPGGPNATQPGQQARTEAEEQQRADARATEQRDQQRQQEDSELQRLSSRSSGSGAYDSVNPMDYFDSSNAYSSPFADTTYGDPWGRDGGNVYDEPQDSLTAAYRQFSSMFT